ncbi:MAG: transporter [Methylorubrum populi]|jgi:hypothetical protein|nr:MAG: transporter [Methylorubrum populi]
MKMGRLKQRLGKWGSAVGHKLVISRAAPVVSAALMGFSIFGHAGSAHAVEDVTPFIPGGTIGAPVGLLPPPGVYGMIGVGRFDFKGRGDTGRDTGVRIENYPIGLGVLWVTDLQILGASYGIGVVQPVRYHTITTPTVSADQFGIVNTILNVGTLSWRLGNGFAVSAGLNIYPNVGKYTLGRPINPARNYATFEPRLGLSYVKDGWHLSSNIVFNVNEENEARRFQSGTLVATDLTATRRIFDKLDFGLGSTIIYQFTDDLRAGEPTPAAGGRGRGGRARFVSLGPVMSYDFGAFVLSLYYQRTVLAENTAGGHQIWSRINFPIYSTRPATQPELESAGRR